MATAPASNQGAQEEGNERRISLRRARTGAGSGGGFSSGISTTSESLRDDGDADLAEHVRDNAPRLAGPPLPPTGLPIPEDNPDDSRRRLAEAAMAGDPSYAREFRLGLLSKLLMRGISLDNIARELGVSVATVKNDRAELNRRLRENAKQLDINQLIGGQLAFYDEATAMSLRMASASNTPTAMRLAGIRTALAAKADQTRFLASAGVFDVLSFRRTEDGQDLSDVQMLMQRTAEMLERLTDDEEAPPDDAPPPPRVVRRQRPGAFAPMQFEDRGGSSGDNEVVDL